MQQKKLSDFDNYNSRLEYLEEITGNRFESIKNSFQDYNNLDKVYCENLVGGISLPLGVAGPIKILPINPIERKKFQKEIYLPLATTEGALVASVSRGAKTINLSGGTKVWVNRIGVTRGPVFRTKNLEESLKLKNWIEKNEKLIKKEAEKNSNHLKFLDSKVKILGSEVFVRFRFDPEDAMGMNMATIATQNIADLIYKKLKIKCQTVSGNFCVDKKPSWQNTINGRGFEVVAEVIIPKKILKEVLRVKAEDFFQTWLSKCMLGSSVSGSMGYNSHTANIVAAMYIATGQDPAHVVEGSQSIVNVSLEKKDLKISITMPAVMLGTVGGGTKLATQSEAISLIGVTKSQDLASVLSAACLAGEISLIGSQTKGTLAKAHKKYGR